MDSYTSKHGRWVATLFFAFAFYGFGAGMMDSFVIYHSWQFVGDSEFSIFHIEAGKRIVFFFVFPLLLMTVLTILLFWHRPLAITRKLVWISLLFISIPWISSVLIQIPMQMALDKGKDEELLQQLIVTDWIRVIPSFLQISTVFIMLYRCLPHPGTKIS
jgi:hypothetical protein